MTVAAQGRSASLLKAAERAAVACLREHNMHTAATAGYTPPACLLAADTLADALLVLQWGAGRLEDAWATARQLAREAVAPGRLALLPWSMRSLLFAADLSAAATLGRTMLDIQRRAPLATAAPAVKGSIQVCILSVFSLPFILSIMFLFSLYCHALSPLRILCLLCAFCTRFILSTLWFSVSMLCLLCTLSTLYSLMSPIVYALPALYSLDSIASPVPYVYTLYNQAIGGKPTLFNLASSCPVELFSLSVSFNLFLSLFGFNVLRYAVCFTSNIPTIFTSYSATVLF